VHLCMCAYFHLSICPSVHLPILSSSLSTVWAVVAGATLVVGWSHPGWPQLGEDASSLGLPTPISEVNKDLLIPDFFSLLLLFFFTNLQLC
jgi:hypothetical protein